MNKVLNDELTILFSFLHMIDQRYVSPQKNRYINTSFYRRYITSKKLLNELLSEF